MALDHDQRRSVERPPASESSAIPQLTDGASGSIRRSDSSTHRVLNEGLPDITATIYRGQFSRVKSHPSAPQRNNAVSQQTLAPAATALPSQRQPAAFGGGFSATSLTRCSSSFLTLQCGLAQTSSYLMTRSPLNHESSSLFPNVPVGQTRLVSRCLSSTTTMPPGRNA